MNFLKALPARILFAVLLLQVVAYYAVASRREQIPTVAALSAFPQRIGEWSMDREYPLEQEVQDVLKADDTLNRLYVNTHRSMGVSLFMAFFRTQRYGQSPHSPKNC